MLAIVIFSSAAGAFSNQASNLSTGSTLSGPFQGASQVSSNSSMSYRVNPGNSSLLNPNSNTTWASRGTSLIQKVSALKIPEKAKLLPNFNAAPQKVGSAYLPSYTTGPAPMGVGSYGIMNNSGNLVPYNYSTTGFEGSVTIQNASELYLGIASPTSYGIQLNAVLNNVTLFGNRAYQYWTQNVALYTGSNHTITFIDNIWNFTSPNAVINGSEFYSYGGNVVPGVFYYTIGPVVSVTFPFTLNLYLNTTNIGNHNTVFFNYSITSGGSTTSASYDEVQFNSTSPGSKANLQPANYEVSGNTLTGTGFIPMDAEMVIGGPGGGSTAVFQKINATMNLDFMNSGGVYTPVASAYAAGSETGETSTGISESFRGTTAELNSGPTLVNPLWGVSGNVRFYNLSGTVSPSNAFIFISNSSAFDNSSAQWSPLDLNGSFTYTLPGGNYSLEILMSYHDPVYMKIDLNRNTSIGVISLAPNVSEGLYTPLYAYNNAQLSNLSIGGTGTTANPFIIPGPYYYSNHGTSVGYRLAPVFSQVNDYLFPTFNGIMISGTNSYAIFNGFQTPNGNPVFPVIYQKALLAGLTDFFQVTSGNYLNLVFYNSSHIILNSSVVSGWFSSIVYSNLDAYNIPVIGSLLLWNTTDSLIEHNTILSAGSGVLIYGPGTRNLNNTIWNNTFSNSDSIPAGAYFGGAPIGLTVAGSGNTVYNNVFNSIIPVVSIDGQNADIFTGGSVQYTNQFNITRTLASHASVFDGISLSGSIVGTSYQAGNYYYDYFGNGSQAYNGTGVGFAFNGEGALNGSINYGYDYSPLVKYAYITNVSSSGLPYSYTTYFDINNGIYGIKPGTSTSIYLPNGSYDILGFILFNSQIEYLPQSVLGSVNLTYGYFAVSGPLLNLTIDYSFLYNLTVSETGLPQGTIWGFSVPGAGIGFTLTNSSQSLYVLPGTYDIFPQSVAGFYTTPLFAVIDAPAQVVVSYANVTGVVGNSSRYSVTFTEVGLAPGTIWGIQWGIQNYLSNNTTLTFVEVPNGTYQFVVLSVPGYSSAANGTFTVGPHNASVYLDFVKKPSSNWLIYLGAGALAGVVAGSAAMVLRFRKR